MNAQTIGRDLIRHRTSGDVYVAEVDGDGYIRARTYPLHHSEWQDDDHNVRPDLDLYDFEVNAEDEPIYDGQYRYLASQAAPDAPLTIHPQTGPTREID